MIGFLSGLFDAEKVKSVMIVLPVAVVCNWQREFEKWQVNFWLFSLIYIIYKHVKSLSTSFNQGNVIKSNTSIYSKNGHPSAIATLITIEFAWY